MARLARIKVSGELISKGIGLPDGTRIDRIRNCDEDAGIFEMGVFEMIVEHPDFRDLSAGEQIPQISPVYKQVQFDWNYPKAGVL